MSFLSFRHFPWHFSSFHVSRGRGLVTTDTWDFDASNNTFGAFITSCSNDAPTASSGYNSTDDSAFVWRASVIWRVSVGVFIHFGCLRSKTRAQHFHIFWYRKVPFQNWYKLILIWVNLKSAGGLIVSGGAGKGTVLDVLLVDQLDNMTPLRCLKCARPS